MYLVKHSILMYFVRYYVSWIEARNVKYVRKLLRQNSHWCFVNFQILVMVLLFFQFHIVQCEIQLKKLLSLHPLQNLSRILVLHY